MGSSGPPNGWLTSDTAKILDQIDDLNAQLWTNFTLKIIWSLNVKNIQSSIFVRPDV